MEDEEYQIQWVGGIENSGEIVNEEVITVENGEETEVQPSQGFIVQEITQISNSLDQIAAENLIYMAQDGRMATIDELIEENIEEVQSAVEYEDNEVENQHEQHDEQELEQQEQYFECQVTEEVITDDWVELQGKERVEIPVDQICGSRNGNDPLMDDIEVPLPTDQDEYTTSRPYPCDFCSRRFRKKISLMNHMVAHQNDRPNVCNLCGARYIRKSDLLNHLKTHAHIPDHIEEYDHYLGDHIESRSASHRMGSYFIEEPLLEKPKPKSRARNKKPKIKTEINFSEYDKLDKSTMQVQEQIPHEIIEKYPILDARKPFVCQQCGAAFGREKALLSHSKIHAGDSPYECGQCNEMFWDINMLNEHQRTHHFEASNSEYEPGNDEETESDDSKYGEYYCNVCGMSFHRQDLLKRHTKTHIKREIISDTNDSTRHCCNVCGETFAEALDLLAHAEIHARMQPFKCVLCGETFLEEATIKKHLTNVHSDEMTANSCKLCGKHCKDSKALMKHAWDHSREKNHSCSKCGKNFHNKARLKRHMTSHRNKSVTCEVCHEEFPDGRSLMNHRHSHNSVSGRQFPCHECGKTFGSRSSQQIHVRIHTGEKPYGCRYCWKAFADGGTLRKHERIHTGEKPYACSVCPRAFNQRVVLREHIRAHHSALDSTRGTYFCTVCNSTLPSSSELIKHLINHSDLNTAMQRQPITGPRKYKRRRKLKPHEIIKLRSEKSNNSEDIDYSDLDISHVDDLLGLSIKNKRRSDYNSSNNDIQNTTSARNRKYSTNSDKLTNNWQQKLMSTTTNDDTYNGVFQNIENTLNNIDSLVVSTTSTATVPKTTSNSTNPIAATSGNSNNTTTVNKSNKSGTKRRGGGNKNAESISDKPQRPKMIHTQKTRVATEYGKRKTRTLITRTEPSEMDDNIFLQKNDELSGNNNNNNQQTGEYELIIPDSTVAVKQEQVPSRTDLFDAQLLLEAATMRKDSVKYTADVISDLEDILRSPIKQKSKSPSSSSTQEVTPVKILKKSDNAVDKTPPSKSRASSKSSPSPSSSSSSTTKTPSQSRFSILPEEDLRRSARLKRTTIPNKRYLEYDMSTTKSVTAAKQLSSSSTTITTAKIKQEKPDKNDVMVKSENIDDVSDKICIENAIIKTESSYYQCEMCCAVFADRTQLLVHVPIHI